MFCSAPKGNHEISTQPTLLQTLFPPCVDVERVTAVQAHVAECDGMIPEHHIVAGCWGIFGSKMEADTF